MENVFFPIAGLPSGPVHEWSINLALFVDNKGPLEPDETGIALASMQNVAQG